MTAPAATRWEQFGDITGPGFRRPTFRHRFTGDPDGALAGRPVKQSDITGLTWKVTGTLDTHVVSGSAGYPASETRDGATYFYVGPVPGGFVAVGARIVFPAGNGTGASAALGLFTVEPFTGTANETPAHLAITPYGMEMAVFTGGVGNFERLRPVGDALTPTMAEFANPLVCDGATEHFVFIVLDRVRGECYVYGPDGRVYRYRHRLFRTVLGLIPFFEPFGSAQNGPVGRFTEVWAYDQLPGVPDGPISPISVAHARTQGEPGAGPPAARPSSRGVPPGSTWRDTVNGKNTQTDGLVWRDDADQISANLLSRNTALAARDAFTIGGVGCTVRRVASPRPTGRGAAYEVTATQAGTIAVYLAKFGATPLYWPVIAGQPYSAGCAKVAAAGPARACYVTEGFYDAANTQVGAVNGAGGASGAAGAFLDVPQVTGAVAPATATQASLIVYLLGVTAGELFYLSELFITPGSAAGYQEP